MKKFYTVKDVQEAGCTLEPLKCVHCGTLGCVEYNQYIGDGYCEECGEWQTDEEGV
jgi:hypothetical protein